VWHNWRSPSLSGWWTQGMVKEIHPYISLQSMDAQWYSPFLWWTRVNIDFMNNEGLTHLDVAFSKIHSDYTFSSGKFLKHVHSSLPTFIFFNSFHFHSSWILLSSHA
jgi:hypothetical protein